MLVDQTNYEIPLTLTPGSALQVDADFDSSVYHEPWVCIDFIETDADDIPEIEHTARLTYEQAGQLHDRLGLILARDGVTDEQVDAAAKAAAHADNADYWVEEIAAWEGSEEWERKAWPGNYPGMAYEERENYRKSARAALTAGWSVR